MNLFLVGLVTFFSLQAFGCKTLPLDGDASEKLWLALPMEELIDPDNSPYRPVVVRVLDCRTKTNASKQVTYTCNMLDEVGVQIVTEGQEAKRLFEALPEEIIFLRRSEVIKYSVRVSCDVRTGFQYDCTVNDDYRCTH